MVVSRDLPAGAPRGRGLRGVRLPPPEAHQRRARGDPGASRRGLPSRGGGAAEAGAQPGEPGNAATSPGADRGFRCAAAGADVGALRGAGPPEARSGEVPQQERVAGVPTRVGVVDLGTNSTRLLVADVDGNLVHELERRLVITRLGEGVDERRVLLPTAVARARNALTDYRRILEAAGAERTLAVATSAVRDAENGEAFLGEIEWSYGFDTRLLSGDEEARLTYRGVANGGALEPGALVLDVGGGSTELVLADWHVSLDLGCVRLTERFLRSDPPAAAELAACREHIRSLLPGEPEPTRAIGVAGTVTTLAVLSLGLEEEDPGLVHGQRLSAGWVEAEAERLAAEPVARLRELRGMNPDRAPVIVAGALVVAETLGRYGLAELEVSEHDLMHGAALEAARLPERAEGPAPPGAYTCC